MELNRISKSLREKKFLNRLFIGLMCLLELILLGAIAHIVVQFVKNPGDQLYNLTALGLMILWFGILVAYYAWAVYFYNINLGLTNEDWAEIREKRLHTPEITDGIPTENPNINETLGLPKGTVRGSLALTLMVAAMAMTIAALGMDSTVKENTLIVDNFDFIKTAFLMMIAFYFGHKSLELIGYKSKHVYGAGADDKKEHRQSMMTPAPPPAVSDISKVKEALKKGAFIQDDENPKKSGKDDFNNPDAVM